jgi:hypothetical protein
MLGLHVAPGATHLAAALGKPVWVPLPFSAGGGCGTATTALGIGPRGCSGSRRQAAGPAP